MINFSEYNSFTQLENLKEEWDRCVLECNSSIYMTFDWCQTWWSFYGGNNELSIQLFYNESKLIGILPLYIEKVKFGHIYMRVCKLVGANLPPKVFDPPIHADYKSSALILTLQNILKERYDVVSLGPVSENYSPATFLSEIDQRFSLSRIIRSENEPYSYFELPENFDEFLKLMSHADRKDFKYNLKRLNRDYKVDVEVQTKYNETDFYKFLEMHHLQWNQKGKLGHFNSWPHGKEFNINLAKQQAELGRYMLLKITKDDQPIFYNYGYKFGDRYYGQLSARSILPENQKYSLGTIGLVLLVKTLFENNVSFIDGGLGYYEYKLGLGAKLGKTFIYRFIANQKSSTLKYNLLEMERKIGGLLFHKIWYRRIQPNLPAPLKTPISGRSIKLDY